MPDRPIETASRVLRMRREGSVSRGTTRRTRALSTSPAVSLLLLLALLFPEPGLSADPPPSDGDAPASDGAEGPSPRDAEGFLNIRIRAEEEGARILEVIPGGAAEAVGLQEGDLVRSADGESLAGMETKEMSARLRGEPGSEVRLEVARFQGPDETVVVTRGAQIATGGKPGVSFLPVSEREANRIGASLRSGQQPDVAAAVQVWAADPDTAAADRALLRGLRDADALGWLRGLPLTPQVRKAFWDALGADESFRTFAIARAAQTRLRVARILVLHRGTAPLAAALVEGLGSKDRGDVAAEIRKVAAAVEAGDAAKLASLEARWPDLSTVQGWEATFSAYGTDLAALELVQDALVAEGKPDSEAREALPADVVRRIERSGMMLPWEPAVAPPEFGHLAAPEAPRFEAERMGGGVLDLEAHEGPIALSFWSTTCGPCRQELPKLQELQGKLADSGFAVWALSIDGQRAKVPLEAEKMGLTLPVGYASGTIQRAYGVSSIPRLFVLDTSHRMLIDHTGYSDAGWEELAPEIEAVARGEKAPEVSLGRILFGEDDAVIAGVGALQRKPTALAADGAGRLWVAFSDEIVPVRFEGGKLALDADGAVKLPFGPSIVRWTDVDGDGSEDLVTAVREGSLVRAARADGTALWTLRHPDGVAEVGVARRPGGGAQVVVLRIGAEAAPHPEGPKPDGTPRDPIRVLKPRVEFLDGRGGIASTVELPRPVVDFHASPDRERVLVVLDTGEVIEVGPGGSASPVDTGLERVRRVAVEGGGVAVTSNGALAAWEGPFGPDGARSWIAQSTGGDIVGLDAKGEPRFRIEVQRRPMAVVTDADGDGRSEVTLWAHWFGLAAIQAGY